MLQEKLVRWIAGEGGGFASFEDAALQVFSFQFRNNLPYQRYCRARGLDAAEIPSWREIPALPTDAFKVLSLRISTFPPESVVMRFLTSGTTREVRGVHEFDDLTLYETSIRRGWQHSGQPAVTDPWFFSQLPTAAPTSSLTHMFGVLAAEVPGPAAGRFLIDEAGVIDATPLRLAAKSGAPLQVFGTAIALLRFSESERACPLPEGSIVFETGGYKGLVDAPEPAAFQARLAEHFGVPPAGILNEYGMTELVSQFYRRGDESDHRGPPWTRVRVVDPETGATAAEGRPGYLEILDLANLGSVCAIRTQDLAIARGERSFTLLGRDPGASPRGCSRAADELLARS